MTTLYTFDRAGYYTGQCEIADPYAPQPAGTTTAPPATPEGQVPLWTGQAWALVAVPVADVPQPTVPQSVTMRQARLALLAVGKLDMINTVIAGIEPVAQRQAIQIEWEYAQTVDRSSPWVAGLAPALALSDADLDSLFVFAAQQ